MPSNVDSLKGSILLGVCVFALVVVWSLGPIAQDEKYHDFADKHSMYGIPNGLNVLSNLAFLVSALMGIYVLMFRDAVFRKPDERPAYWVLFLSLVFTSVGSAYYHLTPNTTTLFWDRLPMTVLFMSIMSILVSEKIEEKLGKALLLPLCVIGVASVSWWSFTELHPDFNADLRFYILVQLAPVLLTPLVVFMYPARYSHAHYMYICALLYILSKAAELFDHGVWNLSGKTLSGHSLKHFLAAFGVAYLPIMIVKRTILKNE